jgi:xanthine dehydrogenase accessory factor
MIRGELSSRTSALVQARTPFVLATVVRARRPTSVRPGDAAVVLGDGTIDGFVGGVCAESSVRLYALRALETGEPLLLRLVPGDGDDGDAGEADDGAVVEHNPCLSGGSLEIFLEPNLPAAQLVIVGGSPIARALERLAAAAGYDCAALDAGGGPAAPDLDAGGGPQAPGLERAAAVVVASHGSGEEAVLTAALRAGVPYVALVASPRRAAAVRAELELAPELTAQLHSPAGLDIGARTPEEIAVSILAELVAEHHAHPFTATVSDGGAVPEEVVAPAPAAVDPVCGMRVAVSAATPQLPLDEGRTVYFCGTGCRDAYARRHAGDIAAG